MIILLKLYFFFPSTHLLCSLSLFDGFINSCCKIMIKNRIISVSTTGQQSSLKNISAKKIFLFIDLFFMLLLIWIYLSSLSPSNCFKFVKKFFFSFFCSMLFFFNFHFCFIRFGKYLHIAKKRTYLMRFRFWLTSSSSVIPKFGFPKKKKDKKKRLAFLSNNNVLSKFILLLKLWRAKRSQTVTGFIFSFFIFLPFFVYFFLNFFFLLFLYFFLFCQILFYAYITFSFNLVFSIDLFRYIYSLISTFNKPHI